MNKNRAKKPFRALALLLTAALLLAALSACAGKAIPPWNNAGKYKLIVEDGDNYSVEKSVYNVAAGENVGIDIAVEDGYYFDGCSYGDFTVSGSLDGRMRLTLAGVRYATRLHIICKEKPTVIVESGDLFEVGKSRFSVLPGDNVSVRLTLEEGAEYKGCSYDNSTYAQVGNTVIVTLKSVYSSTSVIFSVERSQAPDPHTTDPDDPFAQAGIYYFLNGGEFIAEGIESVYYYKKFDISHHKRANTDIAVDKIRRDGYTQLGWNTKEDGSGVHIGLGSRVTVEEKESLKLYAEWAEWANASDFGFTAMPDGVVLTEYLGEKPVNKLVIPAFLQNLHVTKIAEGFAPDIKVDTLVLPYTLKTVEEGAFGESCEFNELYLSDSISEISDESFSDKLFKTVHINAVMSPSFQSNELAHFADDMDRLILNADKKKMVFFSGCSMCYGLFGDMVDAAFSREYFVCDMGVIGGTNATFQMDCIMNYLSSGDVFVHAPECYSEFQMMKNVAAEWRMFEGVEGNYDLLSMADCSKMTGFFTQFKLFNDTRKKMPVGSYAQFCAGYNEYGDIMPNHSYSTDGVYYDRSYPGLENHSFEEPSEDKKIYDADFIDDFSIGNLEYYYKRIEDKGAVVLVSFAPMNVEALSEVERSATPTSYELFENKFREYLSGDFEIISSASDYLFDSYYFYDKDYHLNKFGAELRTEKLIADIKAVLK